MSPLPRIVVLSAAVAATATVAMPATAQDSVISASISGATIDSASDSGGAEQVNLALVDVGQLVDENIQFTIFATGASRSLVRHGRMQLQSSIALSYGVNGGSFEPQVWGAFHVADGSFREDLTVQWDAGFDPTQPIPVRFYRKATIPGGGDQTSTPFSLFSVQGQMRGRVLSGLIEGSAFNAMTVDLDETNFQIEPAVQFADVVVANGAQLELLASLTQKADVAVRFDPDDPEQNVPESRAGVVFFGSMWIEVPPGVIVTGAADVDWTVEPPAPLCMADLDVDGVVAFNDLLIVLSNWNGDFEGDVNADARTDFDDLLAVLAAFGDADCE